MAAVDDEDDDSDTSPAAAAKKGSALAAAAQLAGPASVSTASSESSGPASVPSAPAAAAKIRALLAAPAMKLALWVALRFLHASHTLDDVPDDADRAELELLSPSAKRALNRLLETASLEGVLPKRRRVALPILGPPSEV